MIRTKIVATVGPACSDAATLGAMIDAGVDVLRFNFSHGTLDAHAEALRHIRAHCEATGSIVAVMGDLCGPKIRVGDIAGGRGTIAVGDGVIIRRTAGEGTPNRFNVNYERLIDEVLVGAVILLDDGKVSLRVIDKDDAELRCECRVGGEVRTHVGVNLPDSKLSVPALTQKDRTDLAWAIDNDLDYVALSFVRSPEDLSVLREILRERDCDMPIVAKIEKPEAVACLDEIIDAADALLVARGDLGVEMDVAFVPLIQKDITVRCRRAGKPVIIATQMLQSMVTAPAPTRAEASDVANAIFDAADAVMLSAETAIGEHALAAVGVINRIARETEAFLLENQPPAQAIVPNESLRVTSAVAHGASLLARELDAKLVAVRTHAGNTPRLLAKHRLGQPIIGLCAHAAVCRRMALNYGVLPVQLPEAGSTEQMLGQLDDCLLERGLVAPHDLIVIIAGTHLRYAGATNALLIHLVGEPAGTLPQGLPQSPDDSVW